VVAGLDARLGAQALAVLDHPDVRRAEAAWRGVRFLCDRLAFRRGARLDLLPATRETLDAALHFGVLLPEHAEGAGRVPLAAVVVDHAFEATSADLAALADLAGTGASLQVPVVASAAPAFFGLAAPTDLARLPPVRTLLDQQAYAAFRSLRARPEAAFLALAVPPFVLRAPFGPSNPDRALPVEGGETVWGGAALLAAAAMAARHAAVGWPTLGAGTVVGDLPVRTTRMGALPLSAAFSESVLQDLGRAGFLSFSGPLQTDRAVVGPPATTALPADASADGSAQVSLSAAVFTALAAHRALGIGAGLAGADPDAALAEIDARFRAFLRTPAGAPPEDAVTVQRLDEHETETSHTYGVRLRPPEPILALPVGVVFGVEVPKEAAADGG
jgi:type VI secretion system protein ImpC